ncbi:hypothetical protein AB0G49_27985 [Streptomyces longwoodensis]
MDRVRRHLTAADLAPLARAAHDRLTAVGERTSRARTRPSSRT